MTQLVADEATAVGGDPVEQTADATGTAVTENQPETQPGDEPVDMYPDDAPQPDGEEGEQTNEEGEPEPEYPAIDAPNSWKAEDKAKWGEIPHEVQEIIARRETEFSRGIGDKAREIEAAKSETVQQAAREIADFRESQAQQFALLAAQIMPEQPDERLLMSDDPQHHVLYNRQRAAYENAYAQQQQLQQMARSHADEAQRIQQDLEGKAKAADDARLRDAFPEYFEDSDAGKKLQADLKTTADELGYSELWEQRNAADVLALRKIAEWKADANRWRSYDRNRRNANGTYKSAQRTLPPVTKPGNANPGAAQTSDPVKLLYPND